MNPRGFLLLFIGGVLLLLAITCAYTVRETETAIVTRFGRPVGAPKTEPGLYFKVPFIEMVTKLDRLRRAGVSEFILSPLAADEADAALAEREAAQAAYAKARLRQDSRVRAEGQPRPSSGHSLHRRWSHSSPAPHAPRRPSRKPQGPRNPCAAWALRLTSQALWHRPRWPT